MLSLSVVGILAGGCATPPTSTSIEVPAGQYALAFNAARVTLEEYRFNLDRIDAASGVISTSAKPTSGLATPWDVEQTGLRDETEDLLNHQTRTVRVTFRPAAGEGPVGETMPLTARVDAWIERTHVPNLRPQPRAAGVYTQATDIALAQRGLAGSFSSPLARDDKLAARLAGEIRRRMGGAPNAIPAPSR